MDASENAEDPSPAEDIGDRLRTAREALELSIDEVSAELRISTENLSALEQSRFEALGAPVFAKGYLKQYATRLGLDTERLANEYDRVQGRSGIEIAPSQTIKLHDERQITIWIVAGIVLLALAAALIYWWLGQSGQEPVDAAPEVREPIAGEVAPPASPPVAAEVTNEVPEIPVPTQEADSAEAEFEDPQPAAPAPGEFEAGVLEAASDSGSGPVFEIEFVEDSWAEISNLDGEQLFYDLGRAGTRTELPVDRGLSIFFGNGGGVRFTLGDEPYPMPAGARRGNLAEFDIQPMTSR